jgi:hypothetical protein
VRFSHAGQAYQRGAGYPVEGVDALNAQIDEVINLACHPLHVQVAGEVSACLFKCGKGIGGRAVQHHTNDDQALDDARKGALAKGSRAFYAILRGGPAPNTYSFTLGNGRVGRKSLAMPSNTHRLLRYHFP